MFLVYNRLVMSFFCDAGNYREALRFQVGQQITFDRDAFIQSRPPHIQPFLEKMLQLQVNETVTDRHTKY